MGRTRKEVFVVIVVDECFGDNALIQNQRSAADTAAGICHQTSAVFSEKCARKNNDVRSANAELPLTGGEAAFEIDAPQLIRTRYVKLDVTRALV